MRISPSSSSASSPSSGYESDILYQADFTFKFILVGEPAVGKSCILLQFAEQRFKIGHELTIGADFGSRSIAINGSSIKLKIWDTAGSENFRSITQNYFRGAIGAILVYDVTRRDSFNALPTWMADIKRSCNSDISILLIGNKCDLDLVRQVRYDEGAGFAREHGIMFIEVSARSARNIDRAFVDLSRQVLKKVSPSALIQYNDTIVMSKSQATKLNAKKCCHN